VQVDVSGRAQDVRFTAIGTNKDELCVKDLSVTPLKPEDADPVWQVFTVDPASCIITLRYGHRTANFAQDVPAKPLRPGRSYRVRVSGLRYSITRDFRVTPEHVVLLD